MDKEMHKVTEKIKTAEKDLRKNKKAQAEAVLKAAAKKNEKLVRIDKTQRDPYIEKCEKMGVKHGK